MVTQKLQSKLALKKKKNLHSAGSETGYYWETQTSTRNMKICLPEKNYWA